MYTFYTKILILKIDFLFFSFFDKKKFHKLFNVIEVHVSFHVSKNKSFNPINASKFHEIGIFVISSEFGRTQILDRKVCFLPIFGFCMKNYPQLAISVPPPPLFLTIGTRQK